MHRPMRLPAQPKHRKSRLTRPVLRRPINKLNPNRLLPTACSALASQRPPDIRPRAPLQKHLRQSRVNNLHSMNRVGAEPEAGAEFAGERGLLVEGVEDVAAGEGEGEGGACDAGAYEGEVGAGGRHWRRRMGRGL